jgi:hypothetical protein
MLIVMVVLRHSRRTVRPTEVLLWASMMWMLAGAARMINWYAFALMVVLMPHMADILRRITAARALEQHGTLEQFWAAHDQKRSFTLSLVAALLVWSAFAFSPLSFPVLGGVPRNPHTVHSRQTPLELSEHLRKNPPRNLVFTPQWWGDWLCWSGPPGMRVLMTTNLHLAPTTVWNDYLRLAAGAPGWDELLDRYNVQSLVADKELQSRLIQAVRRLPGWTVTYEDDLGIVAERDKPAASIPPASGNQPPAQGPKKPAALPAN